MSLDSRKELVYNLGDDEHDEEFIYGADYDEVLDVLAEKFAEVYGIDVGIAECILGDFDLYDCLEELYYDDLLEYFRDDAMEQYEQEKEYNSDPYAFYGISESDFH